MRHSLMILSFAAAISAAPLAVHADANTLAALQQAGVDLTGELAAEVEGAQGEALAEAIAKVVASLGNDGEAVRDAVAAAVAASPDLAMEITSAVCLSNPGVCAIAAGAAAGAAPSMAPDIAAAAAQAQPTQGNMILNTILASVNNPSIAAAVERAIADVIDTGRDDEPGSQGAASPN